MKLVAILFSLILASGCGSNTFSDSGKKPARSNGAPGTGTNGSGDPLGGAGGAGGDGSSEAGGSGGSGSTPGTNPDGTGGGGNTGNTGSTPGGGGGSSSSDPIFDGGTSAPVPQECINEVILIVDLKSGWWDGDGAGTFQNELKKEIETNACKKTVEVEYHHILRGVSFPGSGGGSGASKPFYTKDFKTYTQVWVLSGSMGDEADVRLDDPKFVDFVNQIVTHKPRLFLGAGYGSYDHSNAIAQHIWNGPVFKADNASGSILMVSGEDVKVNSYMTPITNSNLFTNTNGPIVDQVIVGGFDHAASDEIIVNQGVTVLANCTTNSKSPNHKDSGRAIPCVGVAKVGAWNIVLDSGLQRFYGLLGGGEEPTRNYFRNIVRALAL